MSQPVVITTATRTRGEGYIYRGSITALHGSVVVSMEDCFCPPCAAITDVWDENLRVVARLEDGTYLHHARCSSFDRPEAQS